MAGVFYISGLNGFRWTLESFTPDPNINGLPADFDIDPQSYAVPIQQTDTAFPALVLLSDYPEMALEFRKCTGELITNPTLGATDSSIIGQTFLQYLATVDFSAFPIGRCYGRISYNSNLPAIINSSMTELASPYIDGNLQTKVDGVVVSDLFTDGATNVQVLPGKTYQFEGYSILTSTAPNPRIRLTVTKTLNGVATVIFDQSEVQTDTSSIIYSGIAQPGATYNAVVATEDTAVMISPINIPDNAPVAPNIISWISCPIDVQQNHPDTQLIQYQNSVNAESVLFHPSNLILQTRIAANFIGGYQPKANRETFEDQPYNPVLLNGFNYDIYTQYLTGDEVQLPDWRIKQLNLIWAKCDQVKIDYDFYVAAGDFKVERPTYTRNRNGYNYEIDLQIVKGFQFGQLTAGTTPTGDLIVVRKTWPAQAPFPTYSSNFAINGVFTQYSTIDYFETINPGLSTFTLKIGTTLGDNDIYEGEIGTPNADASIELVEIHRLSKGFNAATTLYITIPTGAAIGFIIAYDQLDSPAVTSNSSGGKGLPQGMIGYYKELAAGYFTRDWDIATGLGKVGSDYEGCQILDQAAGKVLIPWDRNTIDPAKGRGTPGVTGALQTGTANNIISPDNLKASLPAKGIPMFSNEANNTNGDKPTPTSQVAVTSNNSGLGYEMHKGVGQATLGLSAPLGNGVNLNIANDGLIYLCFIKL